MKSMIKNDFFTFKKFLLILTVVSVILNFKWVIDFCFGAELPGNDFISDFALYPMMYLPVLPTLLCTVDMRTGWKQFGAAMPVKRSDYVGSKYLLTLIAGLIMICMITVCGVISRLLFHSAIDAEYFYFVAALFMVLNLFCAFVTPFCFIGRTAAIAAYMILLVVIGSSATVFLDSSLFDKQGLELIFDIRTQLILFVCTAVLYALSWLISVRIYQNKDL